MDKLRREVERLTAERDDCKSRYDETLRALVVKEWEGVAQADLDAALASPFSLLHDIDQLKSSEAAADEPVAVPKH